MKKVVEYYPKGVCSAKMVVECNDDVIIDIKIIGGCPGNTFGISNLCKGMYIGDAIEKLKGIDCRGRGTSCPDQLSKALEELKKN